MTPREALASGTARLAAAGVPGAAGDARRLLAHAAGLPLDRLLTDPPARLTDAECARFDAVLAAREARRPLSHITGQRLFWGRTFRVTPDVLDPRPETETLIEAALERPFGSVLDLGTGSGCILVSLLADRPRSDGLGVDMSTDALAVASVNAVALGVGDRARFAASDWFGSVAGRFDLIVSNPPYIAAAEMAFLAPEVREWEPHLALTPGGDGLNAYRAITAGAGAHLAEGGRLILEVGAGQARDVGAILSAAGFKAMEIRRDLDVRDRVIVARHGENMPG